MKKPIPLNSLFPKKSDTIEDSVRKIMQILTQYQSRIIDCNVELNESSNACYATLVHMRVYLTLAGKILESCQVENCSEAADTPAAGRSKYLEMSRKLENKYMTILSDNSNAHEFPVVGEVTELHRSENYGRITTMSGRRSYFLRSSFLDSDFDKIKKGSIVEFNEEVSPFGTLATSVRIINATSFVH